MLLQRDVLRRLCLARDLLRAADEERPATVEDVARAVAISPFHFIRQFAVVFGTTPHQFRMAGRLERARRLLAEGELSVTEVCMAIGCSSLGSFSTLFTRRFGTPPSAYRRQVRTLVQVPGFTPYDLMPGCLILLGRLPPGSLRSFEEA